MRSKDLVMVGTKKGAFVFESRDGRKTWKSSGPHFKGTSIYHVTFDPRNRTMLATVDSFVKGPTIAISEDMGRTWREGKKPPRFPKSSDWSVKQLWHIEPGVEEEPGVVYCGVDPAALFVSRDAGETWALNEGLYNQETRKKWNPGAGGLCLHSILVDPRDPDNIMIAISSVGILKSVDGGESWSFKNQNLRADFFPDKYPEFGQCPHHLVRHPSRPDVIYQQNHCGEYRSDDNGETWKEIVGNLPSRFGFPIAVDHNDPKRVYVAPEESGDARIPPNGRFLRLGLRRRGEEVVRPRQWPPPAVLLQRVQRGDGHRRAGPVGRLRRDGHRPAPLQQERRREVGPHRRRPPPDLLSQRRTRLGHHDRPRGLTRPLEQHTRGRRMAKVTVKHSRLSRGASLGMILLGIITLLFVSGFVGLIFIVVGAAMYWFYRRQSRPA